MHTHWPDWHVSQWYSGCLHYIKIWLKVLFKYFIIANIFWVLINSVTICFHSHSHVISIANITKLNLRRKIDLNYLPTECNLYV
jgi:hypothetical protein